MTVGCTRLEVISRLPANEDTPHARTTDGAGEARSRSPAVPRGYEEIKDALAEPSHPELFTGSALEQPSQLPVRGGYLQGRKGLMAHRSRLLQLPLLHVRCGQRQAAAMNHPYLSVRPRCSHLGKKISVDNVNTFGFGLGRISVGLSRIADVFKSPLYLQGRKSGSSPTSGTVFPQVGAILGL